MKHKRLFIYVALAVVLTGLISSCHKFTPESLIAQPWHRILSFKNDGETKVNITSETKNLDAAKALTVLRTGSEINSECRAILCLMSEDELKELSMDYKVIDQSCCKFDPELHFTAGQTGKSVSVDIDGAAILDIMRSDMDHTYVLPFKLQSADSVNVYKNHMVFVFVDAEK